MVQALLNPDAYPEHPYKIELIQTQMSFIFLTGEFCYKIKKPVNLGYLDYTTLEKRHFFCQQELRLNRRLSPTVYLDVLPITQSNGKTQLNGQGIIIEYAVKMKQLPGGRMMDIMLSQDKVSRDMVEQVATKMAAFHMQAATSTEISSYGRLDMIKANADENFTQTEKYIGFIIPRHSYNLIKDYTNTYLVKNAKFFQQRVSESKIRDCHGDLHAAHVCFSDDIYIYDCIEFNDRFRYCDVASEIAFLAMDLDRYGRADLSRSFVEAYVSLTKDGGIPRLLNFYKCYRAYVRGKVACFKYDDPHLRDKSSPVEEARHYFNLAHFYANSSPVLIIMTGIIGSGKTTVAERISRALGLPTLSSDIIRKELAEIPYTEHRYENINEGIYSTEFTRKTYDELYVRTRGLLTRGQSVILDASFKKKAERIKAYKLAGETGAKFLAVECTAAENIIKQRLNKRQQEGSISDGRCEIFDDFKKDFEAVDEIPDGNHLILDTTNLPQNISSLILEAITRL